MARIFISYKRDDKDVVFKIKDDIEKHVGELCWIDVDGIESDAQFVNVIIKAIEECEIFLFMYSRRHAEIVDYEQDWTIREINYAYVKRKRIIFLNIDGTLLSDWFIMMFGLKQQVDISSSFAVNKLYADLKKWLNREGVVGSSEISLKSDSESSAYKKRNGWYNIRRGVSKRIFSKVSLVVSTFIMIVGTIMLYIFVGVNKHSDDSRKNDDKTSVTSIDRGVDDEAVIVEIKENKRSGDNEKKDDEISFTSTYRGVGNEMGIVEIKGNNQSGDNETTTVLIDRNVDDGVLITEMDAKKSDYEYVDLGLSVKWSTHNVGAENPEDNGEYFAWGETESKVNYDWSTYKYCDGVYDKLTKYCNKSSYGNNGFTDNKIVLDLKDDVAHVKWGGNWRMPTDEEFKELIENCTWVGIKQNDGFHGYEVTSNVEGYTERSIFLPVSGYKYGTLLHNVGLNGYYWCKSLDTSGSSSACYVYFSQNVVLRNYYDRYYGFTVRPVCP